MFEPTYEELKVIWIRIFKREWFWFEPTYEELKDNTLHLYIPLSLGLSLPMRNWKDYNIDVSAILQLVWAYLWGIERANPNIALWSHQRFEPTYEELKAS